MNIHGTFELDGNNIIAFHPVDDIVDPPLDPPPFNPPQYDLPLLEAPEDFFSFIVPDNGQVYWKVRHDFENPRRGYVPRSITMNYKKYPPANALPETVMLWGDKQEGDFIAFDKDHQFGLFDWLCRCMGGKLARDEKGEPIMIRDSGEFPYPKVIGGYMTSKEMETAWLDYTANHRFWTDYHSANENGYVDFVCEINLNDPYEKGPMMFKTLTCGGSLVRQVTDLGTLVEIAALDPLVPFPDLDSLGWDIKNFATQETVTEVHWNSAGKAIMWRVSPFPQIRGDGVDGAQWKIGTGMFPIGRGGTSLMNKDELIKMSPGQVFSPHIRNYPPVGTYKK